MAIASLQNKKALAEIRSFYNETCKVDFLSMLPALLTDKADMPAPEGEKEIASSKRALDAMEEATHLIQV